MVLEQTRAEWEDFVASRARPAIWWQGGVPLAINVGFAIGRQADIAIANALGVGVRRIVIRQIDTGGTRVPAVLDRLDLEDETLTFNAVFPIWLAGALCGWRCLCAGVTEFA